MASPASGDYLGEQKKHCTCDDTADELADPVADGVLPGHAAGKGHAEGDGRIDVASADAADGIGHCDHGKTEGDCGTDNAGGRVAAEEHCGSAAQERQYERSDAFCKVLFHRQMIFEVLVHSADKGKKKILMLIVVKSTIC